MLTLEQVVTADLNTVECFFIVQNVYFHFFFSFCVCVYVYASVLNKYFGETAVKKIWI